jgi:hypothetical protein
MTKSARHQVESYRFWDIVKLWSREELEAEEIIARALAKGVVQDGLQLHSVDPRWVSGKGATLEFRGYPYVGYVARPGAAPVVLKAESLEHLLSIVRRGKSPSRRKLGEDFIFREDFRRWLLETKQQPPAFWFSRS